MTQAYEIIMEMESPEIEEQEIHSPIENQIDESLGDLNPRYFEESLSLKEANEKAYSSDINFSSKFNFFSAY